MVAPTKQIEAELWQGLHDKLALAERQRDAVAARLVEAVNMLKAIRDRMDEEPVTAVFPCSPMRETIRTVIERSEKPIDP